MNKYLKHVLDLQRIQLHHGSFLVKEHGPLTCAVRQRCVCSVRMWNLGMWESNMGSGCGIFGFENKTAICGGSNSAGVVSRVFHKLCRYRLVI